MFYNKNKDHRKTFTRLPSLKKADFPSGIFIKPKDKLQTKMNYYYSPYTSNSHYESFMKFDKNKDYDSKKEGNRWSSVKDLIFMPENKRKEIIKFISSDRVNHP